MSIRAVDYQMLIPNTIQQSKVNQHNHDRVRIEHQQLSNEDKKNIDHQLNKVNTFDRKNIYDQKDQNKKNQHNSTNDKNKSKNMKDNNDSATERSEGTGSRIDIKI